MRHHQDSIDLMLLTRSLCACVCVWEQFESKGNVGYMLTQQICEMFAAHDEPQLAAWVPLLGQLHLVGLTGVTMSF